MTASAWPNNATGENHHQVPTELCYVPGKQSYDWGYQIANGQADRLQWFKLLLQHPDGVPDTPIVPLPTSSILGESLCNLSIDDTEPREDSDARLPEFEPPAVTPAVRASKRLTELGIEPVTVVEDFLKGVRQVTLDAIRNTFGKEMVEMNDLEWILSVPAIWSDSAKDLMVKAARGAGFGRHWKDFYLVGEPEAAAAYTLKAIQSHGLKAGDCFCTVDAGGGTCDLITYRIKNIDPVLEIDEAVSGSDELFERYIRGLFGDRVIDGLRPRTRVEMFAGWERVKTKFGNTSDTEFEIMIPGLPDGPHMDSGFHKIQAEDVERIFDPVIERIIKLVGLQLSSVKQTGGVVKSILLVGGLGSSHYLYQRLVECFPDTQVIQPINARTAIARGALLQGLNGSAVKIRRARRSYGMSVNVNKKPRHDGPEFVAHTQYSHVYQKDRVVGEMFWFLKKGAEISNDSPVYLKLCHNFPVTVSNTSLQNYKTPIRAYDPDGEPPEYEWRASESETPKDISEDVHTLTYRTEIYRIFTLPANLSMIPRERFKRKTTKQGEYYVIHYKIKMTILGEVMRWELIFDGKSYGSIDAVFE